MTKHSTPQFMANLRGQLRVNEPMARHTSWRVGGTAEYFYTPSDRQDLLQLLRQLPADMPMYWVGLGSNLLVRDGGVAGIIVRTAKGLSGISYLPEQRVYAEAGVACAKVARFALQHDLYGGEFLAGVPGTFGGALAMNAGAFGGETWQLVESVECVNRVGECRQLGAAEVQAGYREVALPADCWLLGGQLGFPPNAENARSDGKARIRELLQKRNASQPVQTANAGSVFRNPPDHYAARLLEQAGLKGAQVGDAVISDTHANFIINRGAATAADIEQLIGHARQRVAQHSGIELVPEIRVIGRRV